MHEGASSGHFSKAACTSPPWGEGLARHFCTIHLFRGGEGSHVPPLLPQMSTCSLALNTQSGQRWQPSGNQLYPSLSPSRHHKLI